MALRILLHTACPRTFDLRVSNVRGELTRIDNVKHAPVQHIDPFRLWNSFYYMMKREGRVCTWDIMQLKFLLIDDDLDDAELFCAALVDIDHEIDCLPLLSSVSALSKIDDNSFGDPDIIFLDVNMPLVNGWDVLSHLKHHTTYKEIPVVMYATYFSEVEILKAEQLGAACILNKAFNYNRMKVNLTEILERLKSGKLHCAEGILNLGR